MFLRHEHFGFNDIELYILAQQNQLPQIIDPSQVFCEHDDKEQAEVDVVDEEKEEDKILVDHMVNDDIVNHEQNLLPSGHVYCLPQLMTNLNLGADEPSSDIFYNLYMQTKGSLKV